MEREADVLPTPDGILILFLFLLDFCGFTSLGYNDDNSIVALKPHGSITILLLVKICLLCSHAGVIGMLEIDKRRVIDHD